MANKKNAGMKAMGGPNTAEEFEIRHCRLCGCNVPSSQQSWQTHIAGIRHRRNAASCKVFGEPGHAVVSLFEEAALGGSGHLSPPNYQGKDLVLKQGATWSNTQSHMLESLSASTSNRSDRPTSERFMQQSCQHLQQQICAQLAHQVGVNSLYAQALERFGTQRLQDAWRTLTSQLSGQMHSGTANQQQHRQQNVREHLPAVRQESATSIVQHADAPLLPLQQQQQQQQPPLQQLRRQSDYGPSSCLILRPQQPAEIACLALQLPQGKLSLHLTVPYQTFGPAAAATSAAVAVFLASLQRHQHLQRLHLAFHSQDYGAILCQGGAGLSRLPELWRHSMRALTAAMQVNCGLSELELVAYPGQLPAEELAALQIVMAATRCRLRLSVLMGTHPRLGAHSPFLQLPHEVMQLLLNAAVPAHGCVLRLQLPLDLAGAQHGPLPAASSSSEGSDNGSDTDDSSGTNESDSD